MPIRLKYLDFAVLIVTVTMAGLLTYDHYARPASLTGPSESDVSATASAPAAVKTCADYPPLVPDSGWDAVATIPGTNVTFRYPKDGFYHEKPTLSGLASGHQGINLDVEARPTDYMYVYPSFSAYITVSDGELTRESMLTGSINTDDDTDRSTIKRVVDINGRLFLITANGMNNLHITATTSYFHQTIGVSVSPGAWCGFDDGMFSDLPLLDFLRHLDFGDAPKP